MTSLKVEVEPASNQFATIHSEAVNLYNTTMFQGNTAVPPVQQTVVIRARIDAQGKNEIHIPRSEPRLFAQTAVARKSLFFKNRAKNRS
jgi:hypothetical protein